MRHIPIEDNTMPVSHFPSSVRTCYSMFVVSNGGGSSSVITSQMAEKLPLTITAFKKQLEYLLTSQERKEVRKALQLYKNNKLVILFSAHIVAFIVSYEFDGSVSFHVS